MKKLLLTALCFQTILFNAYTQSDKQPDVQNSNLRTSVNSSPKPLKSYAFNGTDSTDLVYCCTSYYQYDQLGNEIKAVVIDTTKAAYLSSYLKSYDALGRLTFQVRLDTLKNDTSYAYVTSYRSDGFKIVTQKGYKSATLDSAGRKIIDSSYIWENGAWKFQHMQRDYYAFEGKKVIGSIIAIADNSSPLHVVSRGVNYQYKDTLLLSYETQDFNAANGQWETYSLSTIEYTDAHGSTINRSYDVLGKLKFFARFDYDSRGNLLYFQSPTGYILNKYTASNSMRQYDFHSSDTVAHTSTHSRVVYDDFKVFEIAAVANNSLPDGSLTLFPNPVGARLNIGIDSKNIQLQNIVVKNALGQTVYASLGREESIDLGHLNSGIYHVELTTGQGIIHKAIVKE